MLTFLVPTPSAILDVYSVNLVYAYAWGGKIKNEGERKKNVYKFSCTLFPFW